MRALCLKQPYVAAPDGSSPDPTLQKKTVHRERDRDKERDRDRKRETDNQTDIHRQRDTNRERQAERDRQTETDKERMRERERREREKREGTNRKPGLISRRARSTETQFTITDSRAGIASIASSSS